MDIKILQFRWSLQEAEDWRGGWGHVLGPRPLPQPLVLLPHPRQAEAQDHLHSGTTGVTAFFNFQTAAQWRFCNKCPNSHVVCILFLCNPYELSIEVDTYFKKKKKTLHTILGTATRTGDGLRQVALPWHLLPGGAGQDHQAERGQNPGAVAADVDTCFDLYPDLTNCGQQDKNLKSQWKCEWV